MDKIKELIRKQDYFNRYWQILGNCETHFEAYNILEDEYLKKYGMNRYSSYNSFINAKSAYIKKGSKRN